MPNLMAGATFKSLMEQLDISGACGRLMMHMLAAFNEFERGIIRERTMAGLEHARAEGRIGGGHPKLTEKQKEQDIAWIDSGEKTQADVARFFNLERSTIRRMMTHAKLDDELRREAEERKAESKRNGVGRPKKKQKEGLL